MTDYGITRRKGHLSVILTNYPMLDSFLRFKSLISFLVEIYLTLMHVDSCGLRMSCLSLNCINSLRCFSFFSDTSVDLGVDPPASQL